MNANRPAERGAALILALMLMVVVGALTTSIIQGNRLLTAGTVDERAAMRALQAAEGGIEQARWRLHRDPHFAGEVLRIGNAEVAVEVEALRGERPLWRVRAIARCLPRGAGGLGVQRCVVADLADGAGLPVVQEWRELP